MKAVLRHLPNMLTGLRLAAAPATAGLLALGHFNVAFGVFAAAGLSDAVDGYLAKRFGLTTRLGRILDPAADKALMLAAFVTLALKGDIPAWVAALVVGRDVGIVLGLLIAIVARAPIVVQPLLLGKLTTLVQVTYVGMHLASLAFGFSLRSLTPSDAYVVAVATCVSAAAYATVWANAMRARRRGGAPD